MCAIHGSIDSMPINVVIFDFGQKSELNDINWPCSHKTYFYKRKMCSSCQNIVLQGDAQNDYILDANSVRSFVTKQFSAKAVFWPGAVKQL